MKVKASVKSICDKCKIVKRSGIVRVICENLNIIKNKDNKTYRFYIHIIA